MNLYPPLAHPATRVGEDVCASAGGWVDANFPAMSHPSQVAILRPGRDERFPPMTDIRKLTVVAIVGLSMLFAPMAMAESEEGEVDAATTERVTAQLTTEGFDVRKLEIEDGMIEAYVVKDGETSTVFLDPATLEIVKKEG